MSAQADATFIYTILSADATLTGIVDTRIFEDTPPEEGIPLPYVIYQLYTPGDVMGVGAKRLWTNSLWTVKAIARQLSYKGDLATAAGRIDALLHQAAGVTADGTVWASTREYELRYPEKTEANDQIRHLGGIYRIMAT